MARPWAGMGLIDVGRGLPTPPRLVRGAEGAKSFWGFFMASELIRYNPKAIKIVGIFSNLNPAATYVPRRLACDLIIVAASASEWISAFSTPHHRSREPVPLSPEFGPLTCRSGFTPRCFLRVQPLSALYPLPKAAPEQNRPLQYKRLCNATSPFLTPVMAALRAAE
jgi:hypothetical protein